MRAENIANTCAGSLLPHLPSELLASNFKMFAVSSAEMVKRMQAGQLKGVKPCLYDPASHTLRFLVVG
jgi:hypothetical protein